MQYLWVFVKCPADTMATIFPNHTEIVRFGVLLNGVTDVAEAGPRPYQFNALKHTFAAYSAQALGQDRHLVNEEHAAGIAMVAVFDDGYIDVNNVAVFKPFVSGDTVAHDVIDRRANGLGEATVI